MVSLAKGVKMPDCSAQNTLNLFLAAATALLVVMQQIFSYFRHKHIMSDNRRLLHVIEAKTNDPGDVK